MIMERTWAAKFCQYDAILHITAIIPLTYSFFQNNFLFFRKIASFVTGNVFHKKSNNRYCVENFNMVL